MNEDRQIRPKEEKCSVKHRAAVKSNLNLVLLATRHPVTGTLLLTLFGGVGARLLSNKKKDENIDRPFCVFLGIKSTQSMVAVET